MGNLATAYYESTLHGPTP